MISRDRVIRALNHQPIDRAPRDLWLSTGIEAARRDDVAEINMRFPSDFVNVEITTESPPLKRHKEPTLKEGKYTDLWGCVWKQGHVDSSAVLASSPLTGALSVADFRPPTELLDAARFAKINAACANTGLFALGHSQLRPLERLCQLRGPETALRELAEGNVELRDLLGRLRDFFCLEAERWAKTEVDAVVLEDDLAWPARSATSLRLWRALIRPFFRDFCEVLHDRDKFAFFRFHGPLHDLLGDMIEIGIDAVHAQWPLEEFLKVTIGATGTHRLLGWFGKPAD